MTTSIKPEDDSAPCESSACITVQDVRQPGGCSGGECIEVHDLPVDGDQTIGVMVYSSETDTKMQATLNEWRAFLWDCFNGRYNHYIQDKIDEYNGVKESEMIAELDRLNDPFTVPAQLSEVVAVAERKAR